MSDLTLGYKWTRRPGDRGHIGFGALGDHLEARCKDIAEAWTREAVLNSKARAHVITGKMKNSITGSNKHQSGRARGFAKVGVYYGVYEEFGTRHREGHPFFTPGTKEASAVAKRRFREIFQTGPALRAKFQL